MEIFRILLRTFIGYFILVAMLKIMGKREIGQLSLFDLIIFLSIADKFHYDYKSPQKNKNGEK